MSIPIYGSLQNNSSGEYMCNKAMSMKSKFESPECLFNFISQNNGLYAIQNVKNSEYVECHAGSMSSKISGDCEKWRIMSIPDIKNGYYIQNVKNNEYLTKRASQLSKNAGKNEVYIIQER